MPCYSGIARIIGCTGTEGRSGTIARNSCSTLLASEISATTNRAMRASSVIVSSVLRLLGFSKSKRIGRYLRCRRSEEHTSELQSRQYLVCRLLLEKKKKN